MYICCFFSLPQLYEYTKKRQYSRFINENKDNLLLVASYASTPCFVEYIICKLGFDYHYTNNLGQNAILIACKAGNFDVIQYLYTIMPRTEWFLHDDYGYNALHYASMSGNVKTVEFLLNVLHFKKDIYTHPSIIQTTTQLNYEFTQPLHLATKYGYLEIVKILITQMTYSAIINRDYNNHTPYQIACIEGHLEIFKYLHHIVRFVNKFCSFEAQPLYTYETVKHLGHPEIENFLLCEQFNRQIFENYCVEKCMICWSKIGSNIHLICSNKIEHCVHASCFAKSHKTNCLYCMCDMRYC
jgi:ankyrin repeat protein